MRTFLSLYLLALVGHATGFHIPTPVAISRATGPPFSFQPTTATSTRLHLKGDLKGILDFFTKPPPSEEEAEVIAPKFESVVIDPDYKPGLFLLGVGLLLDTIPYVQVTLGLFTTLLGILFLVQATRIRFLFDGTSLELVNVGEGDQLASSGENVAVGGANRWATGTIVNYDFFPNGWIDGPIGPLLVYFKETQTPSDVWNDGPGQLANDPDKVAAGTAVPGQVHFFPTVCDARQIRAEFERRGCGKL
jgi:Protein of unknown function (DUF3119)